MQKIESLDKKEALRYLGYGNNEPDEQVKKMLDECEKQITDIVKPAFAYKIFDIEWKDDGIYIPGTTLVFTGESIREHLEGCEKVILMCATSGQEVDRLIRTTQIRGMAKAVIMDALASVSVEYVCNEAERLIRDNVKDYYFTWRFSPGYGDLPIEIQGSFLNVLDAPKTMGVSVTAGDMLTPTKSVTAIIGLSKEPLKAKTRGCISCSMNERCKFRAGGTHCGF